MWVAVIVAVVLLGTVPVVISKVYCVAPAGTKTDGGIVTATLLSLVNVINSPSLGATSFRKIVPLRTLSLVLVERLSSNAANKGAVVRVFAIVSLL